LPFDVGLIVGPILFIIYHNFCFASGAVRLFAGHYLVVYGGLGNQINNALLL